VAPGALSGLASGGPPGSSLDGGGALAAEVLSAALELIEAEE